MQGLHEQKAYNCMLKFTLNSKLGKFFEKDVGLVSSQDKEGIF